MVQGSFVEQEIRKNTKDTGNMWKVIRTCIPKKSTGKNASAVTISPWRITSTSFLHQLVQILSRKSNH